MGDRGGLGIHALDFPAPAETRIAALAELRALVMIFAGVGGTDAIRAINRAMAAPDDPAAIADVVRQVRALRPRPFRNILSCVARLRREARA